MRQDRSGPDQRQAARQPAGRRVRAHHGQNKEPQDGHGGRHHHPPHRRPGQVVPRAAGRRAVLPGRGPVGISGGLKRVQTFHLFVFIQ